MEKMAKLILKRLVLLIVCTIAISIPLAHLQKVGTLQPQGLGIVLLLWVGVVATVVVLTLRRARREYWAERESPERSIDDVTRTRSTKAVRRLKRCIIFLQLTLWGGLWLSRGGPVLPILVGVVVNLSFTALIIQAIVRAQKTLKLPVPENNPGQ